MQYNSHATGQDIVTGIHNICSTNSNTYSINKMTLNVNVWFRKIIGIIQGVDDSWQFDDSTNTTLSQAQADLVLGQEDYSLDDSFYEIERVEVKDSNGNWTKLTPIDQSSIDVALKEYRQDDGIPTEYDKSGRSLFLYPATNYNSTDGLKVYFKRDASVFVTTDTTKEPGFEARFHEYLIKGGALEYCRRFKTELVKSLEFELKDIEKDVREFYKRRDKGGKDRLTAGSVNVR